MSMMFYEADRAAIAHNPYYMGEDVLCPHDQSPSKMAQACDCEERDIFCKRSALPCHLRSHKVLRQRTCICHPNDFLFLLCFSPVHNEYWLHPNLAWWRE